MCNIHVYLYILLLNSLIYYYYNNSYLSSIIIIMYVGVVLDQALKCSCIIDKIVSKSINKLKCIYRNTKGFNWQMKIMIVNYLEQWFNVIMIMHVQCGLT